MKPVNIAGERFGRLIAVEPTSERSGGKIVWRCLCDCGNESLAAINHLRDGRRVSCGCAKLAGRQIRPKTPKHGHLVDDRPSKTYRAWSGMHTRCTNQNSPQFHNYGGRGIKVCDRWSSFNNFLADMGEAPPGLSLDRIDVNGDYAPGNCRWATCVQQGRNKRNNTLIEHNGARATLAEWSERTGLHRSTIKDRLAAGASTQEALDSKKATKSDAARIGNARRWGG